MKRVFRFILIAIVLSMLLASCSFTTSLQIRESFVLDEQATLYLKDVNSFDIKSAYTDKDSLHFYPVKSITGVNREFVYAKSRVNKITDTSHFKGMGSGAAWGTLIGLGAMLVAPQGQGLAAVGIVLMPVVGAFFGGIAGLLMGHDTIYQFATQDSNIYININSLPFIASLLTQLFAF